MSLLLNFIFICGTVRAEIVTKGALVMFTLINETFERWFVYTGSSPLWKEGARSWDCKTITYCYIMPKKETGQVRKYVKTENFFKKVTCSVNKGGEKRSITTSTIDRVFKNNPDKVVEAILWEWTGENHLVISNVVAKYKFGEKSFAVAKFVFESEAEAAKFDPPHWVDQEIPKQYFLSEFEIWCRLTNDITT